MGAAGGVRTRGAARGWSGTVETVLGECWDGLGARSIEQQGRVGLGRAGPIRAGRRLPPYLAGGRAERAGRCRAQPLPAPGALRCGSATPTALGGSCGKGEGKGRESRALFARGASASSRLPDGKKKKIKSVFCLQLLTTAPSGFSTPGAFLPFYVAGFCKPSPCPGTSAARRCPHAESRWSSLSAF